MCEIQLLQFHTACKHSNFQSILSYWNVTAAPKVVWANDGLN